MIMAKHFFLNLQAFKTANIYLKPYSHAEKTSGADR